MDFYCPVPFFWFTKDDADEMNVNDYDDAIQALIHIICYAFDLTLWTKCIFIGDDHWLFANAIDLIVFVLCLSVRQLIKFTAILNRK